MVSKACTAKGVSLGELLIAIMIVAVLSAALFPLFSCARERDNQTTCLSNIRKIGLAFAQYCHDNDQTSILVLTGDKCVNAFNAAQMTPGMELAPYLKSTEVWRCPDDTVASNNDPNTTIPGTYNGYTEVSYGYNGYMMLQWKCGDPWGMTDSSQTGHVCHNSSGLTDYCGMVTPLKISQMKTPSQDGIFFGLRDQWGGFILSGTPDPMTRIEGDPLNPNPNGVQGHANGGCVVYADGHANWLSGQAIEAQRQIEVQCSGKYGSYEASFRPFGDHSSIFHE